ncbi:chromosome 6 open reading frame 106, isoform A, putative [Ixodes scapularis]|uniref:Chromosome 6 open reading frame 106, isoform A, putative n=1 Tax=Ixodes scapularis TaxID=6945 RepID=B7P5H3_IXOSC|nr:chromosome 6 open reading frame 106, isoform A, putative [Ixodes scapularis]|eukprot:XP_002407381.1 chromosome 6 open reading frame 106, isoform A, putative [Ixodes scapularis]
MDIDSDLDLNLLQQFSCLGTTDRDVLVCQLQKVLGYQLNPAGCAFFLDMNNWVGLVVAGDFRRDLRAGESDWPPMCTLRFVGGDHLGHTDSVGVESLRPGDTTDVSVEMASPGKPGIYQGQWRMASLGGQVFGEVIWVILTVAEGGLLAVTQQMEAFHQLGSPPRGTPTVPPAGNPFATSPGGCLKICA